MRLTKQSIDSKDGSGFATLLPEEPEDMWHAYNLIQPGDLVRGPAVRRVTETTGTGSTVGRRVHTTLTIRVTGTDFDAGAAELHVAGRVAAENDLVKLGGFHTLDLELHRAFTIEKGGEGGWDSVALEILREATDPRRKVELWAVVMQEGLAHICLITQHQTILRQKVEVSIPRKRRGGIEAHQKALTKFFDTTLQTLIRQMDLGNTSTSTSAAAGGEAPLLLASPGFTATGFLTYMKEQATSTNSKPLRALVPRVLVAHASSGYLHALTEVLASPAVASKLADTKYARETALMDRFMELLRRDDGRAWYGPREVERAVAKGAVGPGGGVLLISNALFRAPDVAERKRWVRLVDRVRDVEGGEVRVLSSLHESGKRLEALGNVAAILTFPLEDLDEEEEEEKGEGEGEDGKVEKEGEDAKAQRS